MKPPPPIDFDEAMQRLDQVAGMHAAARFDRAGALETVRTADASGRVLRNAVDARVGLPGFANAAMDGFALRGADLDTAATDGLEIAGERFAGATAALKCAPQTCIRITTGAALPPGSDTVVARELVEVTGSRLRLSAAVAPGANVRAAGEDVAAGAPIAACGQVLDAAAIGLLCAAGIAQVEVSTALRVALLVSGDELRQVGAELAPGEIHDSNTPMLTSLFAANGAAVTARQTVPDDPQRIAAQLGAMAASHELVVACGGASVGERDYLPELAASLGTVHFWRVRVRPGMPVLCASIGAALLLVLPGNPVSAFCMFHAFVRPALDRLQGRTQARERLRARLAHDVRKAHDRHELRRGSLQCTADGTLQVALHPRQGSHQLSALAQSNALVHLPASVHAFSAGEPVLVDSYGAILAP